MYFKDSAKAIVQLAEAPLENIRMVNYVVAGVKPIATAQELVDLVTTKIPEARIDFQPNLELQPILDKLLLPIDDRIAIQEWNWRPDYNQERTVEDFLEEMRLHPDRYA